MDCLCLFSGRLKIVILPASGVTSPRAVCVRVVLPAPIGPVIPIISPLYIERFIFDRMALLLNCFEIFLNSMIGKDLLFISKLRDISDLLYRTRRGKTILARSLFVIFILLVTFSILMIVTFPSFIRPRTSIGIINVCALMFAVLLAPRAVLLVKSRRHLLYKEIDILMMLYLLICSLSLLFTERIQDGTPIRMIVSGVIMYMFVKLYLPTKKVKAQIIHVIGVIIIIISLLGILQSIFPGAMNAIATEYFRGREAYGLAIEQSRGRIAPWGNIVLLFPFFFSSLYLVKFKNNIYYVLYAVLGLCIIFVSFVISNFRWMFLVFVMVSLMWIKTFRVLEKISKRQVIRVFVLGVTTLIIGLLIARLTLGYSLIDRFLLSNNTRDVSDTLGRFLLYSQAFGVFLSSPFFGAGVGNYYSLVGAFQISRYFSIHDQFNSLLVPIASHNELLTVLAETGIVGFLCYFFIIYLTIKKCITLMRKIDLYSEIDSVWIIACFLVMISFLLYTLFENIYPENLVYLFMIMSIIHYWFEKPLRKLPS